MDWFFGLAVVAFSGLLAYAVASRHVRVVRVVAAEAGARATEALGEAKTANSLAEKALVFEEARSALVLGLDVYCPVGEESALLEMSDPTLATTSLRAQVTASHGVYVYGVVRTSTQAVSSLLPASYVKGGEVKIIPISPKTNSFKHLFAPGKETFADFEFHVLAQQIVGTDGRWTLWKFHVSARMFIKPHPNLAWYTRFLSREEVTQAGAMQFMHDAGLKFPDGKKRSDYE